MLISASKTAKTIKIAGAETVVTIIRYPISPRKFVHILIDFYRFNH